MLLPPNLCESRNTLSNFSNFNLSKRDIYIGNTNVVYLKNNFHSIKIDWFFATHIMQELVLKFAFFRPHHCPNMYLWMENKSSFFYFILLEVVHCDLFGGVWARLL